MRKYVVDVVYSASGSMHPTIKKGDYLLINKLAKPQIYDVIMFKEPVKEKDYYIKRIMAEEGGRLSFRSGTMYYNGIDIIYEHYLRDGYKSAKTEEARPYTADFHLREMTGVSQVPEDHVFVLGDNRRSSRDSRIIGYIPRKNITGRVEGIIWPKDRQVVYPRYRLHRDEINRYGSEYNWLKWFRWLDLDRLEGDVEVDEVLTVPDVVKETNTKMHYRVKDNWESLPSRVIQDPIPTIVGESHEIRNIIH